MKSINYFLCFCLLLLPVSASAWQWLDLWQSKDQQGSQLLKAGNAQAAAQVFKNKNWQGVANYRAGQYALALKQFSENQSSDGQYNAGNAAAFMEHYQDAIAAYDKAIALNPNNKDAITNREIIKKLLQQQKKPQNSKQNNDPKNQPDKQMQQDAQNNPSSNEKQQQQTSHTQQNQPDNSQQNDPPQSAANGQQQRQDENNKQLLRRLADDPGGLLQQKFMRDYARRHEGDENSIQGVN